MGCGPSQAVIVQQQSSNLQPAIFMVAEESVQLLRDLGELKFYHLAQYGEAEQVERRHGEFANRLANPVESVRNESARHATNVKHAGKTARQSPTRDASNLKARSIVSRVYKVEETTTTELASCSNQMPSAAFSSTTKGPTLVTGKDLATSSMFQNECPGDMLANPGQIIPVAANHSKVFTPAPSSSSPHLTSASAQTQCTSASPETKPKTKTFFGRNRVRPKANQRSAANGKRYLSPLRDRKLEEATAQGTEGTELKGGYAWVD